MSKSYFEMDIIKKEDLLLPKLEVLQEHIVFFYWKIKKKGFGKLYF